jgi:hypothetical protein
MIMLFYQKAANAVHGWLAVEKTSSWARLQSPRRDPSRDGVLTPGLAHCMLTGFFCDERQGESRIGGSGECSGAVKGSQMSNRAQQKASWRSSRFEWTAGGRTGGH